VAAFGAALGLLLGPQPAFAQTGTIEGQVTSASTGEPISAVQVSIVGTNIGTTTGLDGRFVLLNVPAGQLTLRAVAIGFKVGTLQLAVQSGQMTTADIALTRSVLQLDAVVVTGTAGAARVREVGNTIGQINVDQDIKDPPASVDQLLQARVTGLNVMQASGMAGSGARIQLRGAGSVSQSNQPIIYIDGIRVRSEGYRRNGPPSSVDFRGRSGNVQASPLNDINPADIERVEVIKGSAASTLYGTEASAGVIQIFTRKGSRGAPRWNFQVDQGFTNTRPFGTDANPYVFLRPKDNVDGQCHERVAEALAIIEAGGSAPDVSNCSWLRSGYRQKYSGSVAGGVGELQYFISGSWEDNDAVLPLDNEQKFATRANFSVNFTENLRFDWNTSYTNLEVSNTPAGNNARGLTLNVYRQESGYLQSRNPIVLDSLLSQEIITDINRLITGGTIYYTPFPWFTNRFTIGYDLAQQENRNNRPFGFLDGEEGRLFDEQVQFTTLTADYVGNVDYRVSGDFIGTFSFGGQSITTEEIRTFAWGRTFPGPGDPTVSNAGSFISQEDRERIVNAGFFFQNVFKLKDRWFLTGGVRFDGNSAFGTNLGLEAYPKASLSYVISDESFWPDALGDVKLRGAVGWSGRAPGAFDAVRVWDAVAFAGNPAFIPDNVGNPDLGPERTREIEFGMDGGFLGGRLSTEFTWYHQKTDDALFDVTQVPSGGFGGEQLANVGTIRNTGIEAAVNATVIDQANWGLDLGTSIYTNKSLVLELGDATPFLVDSEDGDAWIEEGFPVMAGKGVNIKNGDAIAAPDTVCVASAGDPCAQDGQWIFGPQEPEVIVGVHGTLRFPKGITLSARGEYQAGAWIFDNASVQALRRSVDQWPLCENAFAILAGGGTEDQWTARERVECDLPLQANGQDAMWFPQDFFKLRDVTLSVPLTNLFQIPRVETATLTLTAQNFVRWINSDLRLFDPEMGSRSNISEPVREIAEHVPPPAVITASLRVTF
jgi:TonB-linked SusC/RagA family outer membrane protein